MSNKSTYIKICEQNKELPVFVQPWWLDSVCADWDVAIAKKGEHVTGVWPYALDKKIGVSIMRNPKLTPYLGPVVLYPDDIKESNEDGYEHETISELIKQLPEAKVWHLALTPGLKQAGLFKHNKLQLAVQQTFLLPLQDDEATLLANMKDTTRRNIRQAEKEVVITNMPEHLPDLYNFQKNTLESKGITQAYTLADMQRLMAACLANGSAALWVAKAGSEIQAIVWQVWDEQRSYYLMGGQNHATNNYRAMTALLWHMIKDAKKRGNDTFDFEGSMDEGVERFFRGFGGTRELYIVLQRNDSFVWQLKQKIR